MLNDLPQEQHSGQPYGILVVDDNSAVLNSLKGLLKLHGYRVYTKPDPDSALDFLHSGKDKVNLIISDIKMPHKDGFEFYSKLQDGEETRRLPFIVLSVINSSDEIRRAKELGIDDFVTKPFIAEDLLASVKGKIQKSEAVRQYADNRISKDRKRIIQTISHELRTPLVLINTGSELLREQLHEQPLTNQPVVDRLVDTINRGAQDLDRKVEDFLTVQQLEFNTKQIREQIALHAVNVNFAELIQKAVKLFLKDLKENPSGTIPQINLSISQACKNIKIKIFSAHISDACIRILSNAYKFNSKGKDIDVEVRKSKDRIYCLVRDYGSGFTEDSFREACKELSQINRDKLEQQGCGLGLTIAGNYVRLNGGTIDYQTPPHGKGSIIRVSFPLNQIP